jgi:hypothetical protein
MFLGSPLPLLSSYFDETHLSEPLLKFLGKSIDYTHFVGSFIRLPSIVLSNTVA